MKLFLIAVLSIMVMLFVIGNTDDGLTTRERHDIEYARNIASEREHLAQCYQGNKRACKIAIYSSEQIEKYRITYPNR